MFQRKSFIANSVLSVLIFSLLCIVTGNYFSCIAGLYSRSVCSPAVPPRSTEVARYRFASFARNNLVTGNSPLQISL